MMGKLRYSILSIFISFKCWISLKNECIHKIKMQIRTFRRYFWRLLPSVCRSLSVWKLVSYSGRIEAVASGQQLYYKRLWYRVCKNTFSYRTPPVAAFLKEYFSFGIIFFKFITQYILVKPWPFVSSREFSSTPWFKLFDIRLIWCARFLLKGFLLFIHDRNCRSNSLISVRKVKKILNMKSVDSEACFCMNMYNVYTLFSI